jgi:hypothetical protein
MRFAVCTQFPTEVDVVARLRCYLHRNPINDVELEPLVEGVRRDDNWYCVPVLLKAGAPPAYQYYDMLIEIEEQFRQQEHLNVLLVPAN